jgi:hypothetical protein
VLLGAQRFDPSLGDAVETVGVRGHIATITAGWQERESDDDDLKWHLEGRAVNLQLHKRGDEVFRDDPELRAAHRERQDALRHRQDFYRIRLEHAVEADRVIRQRAAPPDIAAEQAQESADAIRELDEWHLGLCAKIRGEFEAKWKPSERDIVKRHRDELAAIIADCGAIAIAGGQVATLINRLMLFGIAEMIGTRAVFAWSAGAMAISDRIVLFHDDPPQGPGVSEVLDTGLGLAPGLVALPQPETRLRLDDSDRVQRLVKRFQPARSFAFPARAWMIWRDGKVDEPHDLIELLPDGRTNELGAAT